VKRSIVAVLVLLLCIGAAAPAPAAPGAAAHRGGPGCDPARPAVAHRAGGVVLRHQPRGAAIPCAVVVGPTSESADVGVTRSGSVVYAPLNRNTATPPQNVIEGPEQVVRSRDGGATWTELDSGGPTTGGLVPPWMSVDPRTSRIWFATTLPSHCGARISWSDDDGDTWHTNPSVGCPAMGGNKVMEGPAPRGGAQPVGYPHVVYYCALDVDGAPTSLLWCYKSLDGGTTFTHVGGFPNPVPPPPACGTDTDQATSGLVGPDGVLYVPLDLCGTLGLATSHDEGATWQSRPILEADIPRLGIYISSMAVDTRGNLYIVWMDGDGLLNLTTSRDHGNTWTTPINPAAPGVQRVRRVAITARQPGHIALAYTGTTDGTHYNGYITETTNALARRPAFWSATVNDPARPLANATDTESFGNRFFYGTTTIAADGTVWAGFHCARTEACPGQRLGIVGRLVRPSHPVR
jgi:hypothetical protein